MKNILLCVYLTIGTVFLVGVVGCLAPFTTEVLAPSEVYYYMSPDGNDENLGTEELPVATLGRIQELLFAGAPNKDIVVRIISNKAPYINQNVVWTYYNPTKRITFEPYPDNVYALFIADWENPTNQAFFKLDVATGKPTNLVFRKLFFRDYTSRVFYFRGDRENPETGWNGYNRIEDCKFYNIGNQRKPDAQWYASVIGVVNSRYNTFDDCEFAYCANDFRPWTQNPGLPYIGIYFAHYSEKNIVIRCTFFKLYGDGIRLRDASNHNNILYNQFIETGWDGAITAWYCDPDLDDCTKILPECPSCENTIKENILKCNWACGYRRLGPDISPRIYYDKRPNDSKYCIWPIGYECHKVDLIGNTIVDDYDPDDKLSSKDTPKKE